MSPAQRAAAWHRERFDTSFREIVEEHGEFGGHVIITPEVFVMGRPTRSEWADKENADAWICNPRIVAKHPNCWHVWLLAGDFRAAWKHLPYDLPFISFHRRGVLRVLPLEAAKRMLRA